MPVNKPMWCNDDWLPYHYAFVPNERAWKWAAGVYGVRGPYPTTTGAACTHFTAKDTGLATTFVTIYNPQSPRQAVSYLIHEASHVWRRMREEMGELSPSSEFEAYSLQAIADRLIAAYEYSRGPLLRTRLT